MFTRKNVIRACFAAVLAIGLAACGGGSSTPETPPPTQAEMDRTAIDGAISAATAAIDGLTAMSSDADVAAAQAAIVAAQAALDGSTALSLTEARALQGEIAATRTALGAKQTAITGYRTHMDQHTTAMNAVDAATAAIDGLTAMSSDADVAAAQNAVTAAEAAIAAGTMLTEGEQEALNGAITLAKANLTIKRTLVSDQQAEDMQGRQRAAVGDAIDAAMRAVGALTAMSSDADVAAAQGAIGTAQAALEATTVLPATDVRALQARIDTARSSLDTAKMQIADYATHQGQLSTAGAAVHAAEMAVAGLTAMSDDAAVSAAADAIAAAKQAVADGTMLTAAEMGALNGDISTAEMDLGTARMAISDYRTHMEQHTTAMNAVEAAKAAIGGLTAMSTAADAEAAALALEAAEKAVADGTMLTATERAVLNGEIALARLNLATARTDISEQQMRNRQHTAATDAVGAAEAAVDGLTEMSTDADANAAGDAIATARATLALTTALPASEILALEARIAAAEESLGSMRMAISDYQTHTDQRSAANAAVEAAEMAVAGLTKMSDDAAVSAAAGAIEAAKQAVAAGTMLTDAEKAMLNGDISAAETNLSTARMDIDDYQTHRSQLSAADAAVDAAANAVAGLTEMSSETDVMAADSAIKEAEAAVAEGTMLTEAEAAALNGRIALAKVSFQSAEMMINSYKAAQTALSDAREKVDVAEMAVAGLTDMSDDDAVEAAETAINEAEEAVAKVTDEGEAATLKMRIATAKTNLDTVETRIATYRELQTANRIVMLHREALGATKDAEDAGEAAAQAVKDAEKYSGRLDVEYVKGDSTKAMMNAQKVLDASGDVADAVMDAEAAKKRAMDAKTQAEAIDDGTEGKAQVLAALDDAIEAAEKAIADTMAIHTGKNADGSANDRGQDLKEYVRMVTGRTRTT